MYLSLGSDCTVALKMKDKGVTYFFDYLWNQYDGLRTVSNLIQNNFKHMNDINNYRVTTSHPVLNTTNVKEVLNVNIYYPNVVFLHHDTSKPEIIDSLNRKIARTIEFLNQTDYKVFVYTRKYNCNITKCTDIQIIVDETKEFCDMYRRLYNDNFSILSYIHSDIIMNEDLSIYNDTYMKFDYWNT